MIRLLLILLVLAVCLATVCAEVYAGMWLFAHGMALASRHPLGTIVAAIVFLGINWAYVRGCRLHRAQWWSEFFCTKK